MVSLSFTRLAVTSSYTGASVAVFGAVERDGQAGRAPAATTWW